MHPSTASRKDGKNLASIIEFCVSQKRPSKEGFDIVIGNPPYGAKYDNETKRYYKNTYVTANSIRGLQKGSLDTYTLFIELGYNLLRRDGSFAYI